MGKKDLEKVMAITTSTGLGALVTGERPYKRKHKLDYKGGSAMAMRGNRKKKKKTTSRGNRRKK